MVSACRGIETVAWGCRGSVCCDHRSRMLIRCPDPFKDIISMAETNEEFALGLTTGGFILFIVLLFVCLPLCWLPWVLNGTRANKG